MNELLMLRTQFNAHLLKWKAVMALKKRLNLILEL